MSAPNVVTLQERVAKTRTMGMRLRIARELSGLSLGQAARLFDVKAATVSTWELEDCHPGDRLAVICSTYGCSEAWARAGRLAKVDVEGLDDEARLLPGIIGQRDGEV